MTQEEMIRQCRYYKGEEECPYKHDGLDWVYYFWRTEREWVYRGGAFSGCWFENEGRLGDEEWEEYKRQGGKEFPDLPDSLLSFFWHGFLKAADGYGYDIKEFYEEVSNYIKTASSVHRK